MKKCKFCGGTGLVPKKPSWYWSEVPQTEGLVKKKDQCPKCYGKGIRGIKG